jgi:hypothetical protein
LRFPLEIRRVSMPGAELKAFTTSLASKLEGKNVVTQDLATHGSRRFMVAHRDSPGEAEYHAQDADIFVVQSGTATLV